MKRLWLSIALWSAYRAVRASQPSGVKLFLEEGYKPPSDDEPRTHVVVGSSSIVLHEYSADRRGDHHTKEFRSLRNFLRDRIGEKAGQLGVYFGVQKRFETLTKTGKELPWDETLRLQQEFESDLKNDLERFFSSLQFRLIERFARFDQ